MAEEKDLTPDELRAVAHAAPWHYATGARLRTTAYDVSVLFTRSVPVGQGRQEYEEPVCVLSMSPALMMSMFKLLEKHVRVYEEKHGVKLPNVPMTDIGSKG